MVRIDPEKVLPINDRIGFNPAMEPPLWDEGKVAIIQGIGYPHEPLALPLHAYLAHL